MKAVKQIIPGYQSSSEKLKILHPTKYFSNLRYTFYILFLQGCLFKLDICIHVHTKQGENVLHVLYRKLSVFQ